MIKELNFSEFIDKCLYIAIFGAAQSGKTIIIQNILSELCKKNVIPLVVSPTNLGDSGVFSKILPKQLIFNEFKFTDKEKSDAGVFIKTIMNNQEKLAEMENNINNNIDKFIKKTPIHVQQLLDNKINKAIEKKNIMEEKIKNGKKDEDIKDSQLDLLNKKHDSNLLYFKKNYLLKFYKVCDFSSEDKKILKYIDCSPWKVIVMDDCAAEIKKKLKGEDTTKLIYNGRHYKLRIAMTFQDDTDVPPNWRKGFMGVIFTTKESAQHYFESTSNGLSKETKKNASLYINHVFNDCPKYTKLIYSRHMVPNFFKYKFEYEPSVKLNKPTLELCKSISK